MKQMNFKWFLLLAVMALPLAFCSCSSDDDDNGGGTSPIEAPKYEADAAKYEITSTDAEYASIELTGSGNYIIMKNTTASGAKAMGSRAQKVAEGKRASLFRSPYIHVASRAGEWGSGILYGTYTKTGDNEYKLSGLGTLKVTVKNGVACSLDLTYTDGATKSFDGNKGVEKSSGDLTNFMCRTWSLSKIRAYYKENGQTMFDITGNSFKDLAKKIKEFMDSHYPDNDFDESDFIEENPPVQFVITKNNTYMVIYEDNEVAVANWKWQDESKGLFYYSWDEEGEYGDDESGTATVSRSGNNLVVFEEQSEVEDGLRMTFGTEYTCTEVK